MDFFFNTFLKESNNMVVKKASKQRQTFMEINVFHVSKKRVIEASCTNDMKT